jgi:hypothetical protein
MPRPGFQEMSRALYIHVWELSQNKSLVGVDATSSYLGRAAGRTCLPWKMMYPQPPLIGITCSIVQVAAPAQPRHDPASNNLLTRQLEPDFRIANAQRGVRLTMPVSETKRPKDAEALHNRIRGPSKGEIEAAVLESLGVAGDARYIETDRERSLPITAPCLVFLVLGSFKTGDQECDKRYLAYHITDENTILLGAYSVVVVIQVV